MPYIEADAPHFRAIKRTARRMHSPRLAALCDNIVSRLLTDAAKQRALDEAPPLPEGRPYAICGHIVFVDLTAMHALALVALATEWARAKTAWYYTTSDMARGITLTDLMDQGRSPLDVIDELRQWGFYPKTEAALLRALLAKQEPPFNVRVTDTGPTVPPEQALAHSAYIDYLRERWEANLHETADSGGDLYPRPYHLPPKGSRSDHAGWSKHALTECFQRIAVINGPVLGDDKDTSTIRGMGERFNGRNLLRGENSMLVPLEDGEAPRYDVIIAGKLAYEGIDLQTRTCAVHHLDGSPWTPAILTQRNGRAVRQGNLFDNVTIYSYLSDGSVDYYRLNRVRGRKAWLDTVLEKGRADADIGGNGVEDIIELQVAITPADKRAVVRNRLRKQYSLLHAIEQRRSEAEIRDLYVGLQGVDNNSPRNRALLQRFYGLHLAEEVLSGARNYGLMLSHPPRFLIDGVYRGFEDAQAALVAYIAEGGGVIPGHFSKQNMQAKADAAVLDAEKAITAFATDFDPKYQRLSDMPNIIALYSAAETRRATLTTRFEQTTEGWHGEFFALTAVEVAKSSDGLLARLAEPRGFVMAPARVLEDHGICVTTGRVYQDGSARYFFTESGGFYTYQAGGGAATLEASPSSQTIQRSMAGAKDLGPLKVVYADLGGEDDSEATTLVVPPIKDVIADAETGEFRLLCRLLPAHPPADALLASALFIAQALRANSLSWPSRRIPIMEQVEIYPHRRLRMYEMSAEATVTIQRTGTISGRDEALSPNERKALLEQIAKEGDLPASSQHTDVITIEGRHDDAIQAIALLFAQANPYTKDIDPAVWNGSLETRAFRARARTAKGTRIPTDEQAKQAKAEGLVLGDLRYPGFRPRAIMDDAEIGNDGSVTFGSIAVKGDPGNPITFQGLQDFYDRFWNAAVAQDGPLFELGSEVWEVPTTLDRNSVYLGTSTIGLNRIVPGTMSELPKMLCVPAACWGDGRSKSSWYTGHFPALDVGLLGNWRSPTTAYTGPLTAARNAVAGLTTISRTVPKVEPTQQPLIPSGPIDLAAQRDAFHPTFSPLKTVGGEYAREMLAYALRLVIQGIWQAGLGLSPEGTTSAAFVIQTKDKRLGLIPLHQIVGRSAKPPGSFFKVYPMTPMQLDALSKELLFSIPKPDIWAQVVLDAVAYQPAESVYFPVLSGMDQPAAVKSLESAEAKGLMLHWRPVNTFPALSGKASIKNGFFVVNVGAAVGQPDDTDYAAFD